MNLLYHHLRCQLLHEGEMPECIVFTEPLVENGKTYNVLQLRDPLGFPEGWVVRMATAARIAPENSELWQDESSPGADV